MIRPPMQPLPNYLRERLWMGKFVWNVICPLKVQTTTGFIATCRHLFKTLLFQIFRLKYLFPVHLREQAHVPDAVPRNPCSTTMKQLLQVALTEGTRTFQPTSIPKLFPRGSAMQSLYVAICCAALRFGTST